MSNVKQPNERRNTSPVGTWNRAQFETSARVLRAPGLSVRATDYFRRRARLTRQLPHELLVEFVEEAVLVPERAG